MGRRAQRGGQLAKKLGQFSNLAFFFKNLIIFLKNCVCGYMVVCSVYAQLYFYNSKLKKCSYNLFLLFIYLKKEFFHFKISYFFPSLKFIFQQLSQYNGVINHTACIVSIYRSERILLFLFVFWKVIFEILLLLYKRRSNISTNLKQKFSNCQLCQIMSPKNSNIL